MSKNIYTADIITKSIQNADVFIKCLDKYSYIEDILKDKHFKARYVEEKFDYLDLKMFGTKLHTLTLPMVCFCDIPLNKLSDHIEWYGDYGMSTGFQTL